MARKQKIELDIYNDPNSLFYIPFTNDNPTPAQTPAPQKEKPIKAISHKIQKESPTPLENRFNSSSKITPLFTNQDENNAKNKIIPFGTMNSYFYAPSFKPSTVKDSHKDYLEHLKEQFKQDGTKGLPELILREESIINIFQKWKLSENTLLFADGASGIYRALTAYKHYFEDFQPLYDANGGIVKYQIYATFDQLKKCFFGVCVDEFGNLKRGTSEILKKSGILKEFTDALFMSSDGKSTGKEPLLFMYDKTNNFLGYYKPIIFEGYDRDRNAFKVLLDPKFFKLKVDEETHTLKTDVRYIPTINGLTALSIIGRAYLSKENPSISLPNSKTATRLIHTLQASMNCQNLLGIERLFPEMNDSKQKIRLNKSALVDLFPSCYRSDRNYLDFKKASEQVGFISDIIYKGLEVVDGYSDFLSTSGNENIYLPSIDKSCYFDNRYSKAVFVNCETPKQAIMNTQKTSYLELKKELEK